jgi:integrase
MPTLNRPGISPHTFRHTKAMHLLQAKVPLVTIKDFLGHADVKSTEVYVQIDLAMKRDALTLVGSPVRRGPKGGHLPKDVLDWLEAL